MIARAKAAFLGSLVALAVLLGAVWVPAAALRKQAVENKAARAIRAREIYVSPAELATLMHDGWYRSPSSTCVTSPRTTSFT